MTDRQRLTDLERRMLSGRSFIYSDLCRGFARGLNSPGAVPKAFDELEKAKLIERLPKRDGGSLVWCATDAGRSALAQIEGGPDDR